VKADPNDNKRNETMYFYADTNMKAHQLVGKWAYQVTFPKGQFLPVKGFWSLMVYNTEHVFSPNAINRFSHMEALVAPSVS
jgi:hypothetical protein